MTRWLDEIEDVDGSDRVVQNMNSEINGPGTDYNFDQIQGAMDRLFEPKAAANYQRNVKGIRELDHERAGAVRQNGEDKPMEVDMISEDGDLIETKSSSKFQSIDTSDSRYDDLDAKLERFQKYKRSEGYDSDLSVVFRVQPSDDVYDLLTSRYSANCWVTTQDGGMVPCKR